MPIVSMFYGIKITMYFSDHSPPHFHVEYAGHKAVINILDATVMRSALPKRQLKLVLAWAELHRDQLMQNWEMVKENREPLQISPLS